MLRMREVHVIRHKVEYDGDSIRGTAKDLGISRNTVRKYLKVPEPIRLEKEPRKKPVLEKVAPRIDELLEEWKERTTVKQRLTGTRIHQQLVEEGYKVGSTTVREYLAEKKREAAEVFIPLVHRPGEEAQVDFFEVTVEEKGVRKKAWKFVMRLMYAGWDFAWIYERCDQVSFLDGHVRAFRYFNGIPRRCIYDNLKAAVRKVVYPNRELTNRFQALVSYYLFEPCFTRVGEGHDKGGVESRGKGIRLQHLTPIPRGDSLRVISNELLQKIEKAAATKTDAEGRSVAGKIEEERRHLRALPIHPFDPSRLHPVSISSKSTVIVEGARYSLPSHWARLDASAYVGVDQVRIVCRGETMTYPKKRRGESLVRYRHYLREFARKPQAVRQMAPELMGELGEPFQRLWALLEETHGGKEAGRIMAKVLKAIIDHSLEEVKEAVQSALEADRVDLLGLASLKRKSEPETVPVPEALKEFVIEKVRATDYDFLLRGGYHD
ncbi:MAG: IS21 family transposase [bacterium]